MGTEFRPRIAARGVRESLKVAILTSDGPLQFDLVPLMFHGPIEQTMGGGCYKKEG